MQQSGVGHYLKMSRLIRNKKNYTLFFAYQLVPPPSRLQCSRLQSLGRYWRCSGHCLLNLRMSFTMVCNLQPVPSLLSPRTNVSTLLDTGNGWTYVEYQGYTVLNNLIAQTSYALVPQGQVINTGNIPQVQVPITSAAIDTLDVLGFAEVREGSRKRTGNLKHVVKHNDLNLVCPPDFVNECHQQFQDSFHQHLTGLYINMFHHVK